MNTVALPRGAKRPGVLAALDLGVSFNLVISPHLRYAQ
jgi:hypothetical protein